VSIATTFVVWKEILMKSTAQRNQAVGPNQPPSVKKLLKVKDVADILGVSPVKVYALLKTGLPSLKIDGARRFHPDKLQAWIEQHSA
jgi:hypothetical protein